MRSFYVECNALFASFFIYVKCSIYVCISYFVFEINNCQFYFHVVKTYMWPVDQLRYIYSPMFIYMPGIIPPSPSGIVLCFRKLYNIIFFCEKKTMFFWWKICCFSISCIYIWWLLYRTQNLFIYFNALIWHIFKLTCNCCKLSTISTNVTIGHKRINLTSSSLSFYIHILNLLGI